MLRSPLDEMIFFEKSDVKKEQKKTDLSALCVTFQVKSLWYTLIHFNTLHNKHTANEKRLDDSCYRR